MTPELKKKLIDEINTEERLAAIEARQQEINDKIDVLLEAIVVRQKDGAEIAGVTEATVINRRKRGEINILQADGSRSSYLTLQTTKKLKERRSRR